MARAGLAQVAASGFMVMCIVVGLTAALAVQLVSRTPPVAVAFGLIAGYLPVAIVAGRARRRQRELAEVWPEAVDNLASAVRADCPCRMRWPLWAPAARRPCARRSTSSPSTIR